MVEKGVLYYTDNVLDDNLANIVRESIGESNLPIVSVSLKPIDFGKNIVFDGERGYLTMFRQILTGLKESDTKYIFMCEHDVLYHPSHFEFTPPRDDVYYYNSNAYKYRLKGRIVVKYYCRWLSQLCANRELLMNHYDKKIEKIEECLENGLEGKAWRRYAGYEPGTGRSKKIDNHDFTHFTSKYPNIDIRHGGNLSGDHRFKKEHFKDRNTCKNFKEHKVSDISGWDTELLWNLAS